MRLKKQFLWALTLVLSITGIVLIFLVMHETNEQMVIIEKGFSNEVDKILAIKSETYEIFITIVIAIFVALVSAFLIISYLTNRFLAPLLHLTQQLETRSSLNLKPIMVNNASKEIVVIVKKVNQLLSNVSERIEHEKQFTSDVAHELRTPLAGMRLTIELIEDLPEKSLLLERIDDLLRTIERLLHFSRASHKLHLQEMTPFNLSETIIPALKEEYQDYSHPLVWEYPPKIMIRGDQELLVLMLKNLLDNAHFYAANGKETRVCISQNKEETLIVIEDNGQGVTNGQMMQLLQSFHRIDQTRNGFGLGLNFVERIVHAHNGRLYLKHREDGKKGLRVEILLPF